jgi:hypothetical protein
MPFLRGSLFQAAKARLRTLPFLVTLKRKVARKFQKPESFLYGFNGTTNLNVVTAFPLYAPLTSGSYEAKADATIETINRTIPLLSYFAKTQTGKHVEATEIQKFATSSEDLRAADEFKKYFDKYGSDKTNSHNYHKLYGPLLKDRDRVRAMLEIGIGTNFTDVLSNMGQGGEPGGSLRAFRDFLTNATIYGADIDRRILFEEQRIKTYYVDQTDFGSFENLGTLIPSELDLIIDDGLHSPNANINTLIFGLTRIKVGGSLVIEDIALDAIPVWEVIAALLPANYTPHIITAAGFMMDKAGDFSINDCAAALFVVRRVG